MIRVPWLVVLCGALLLSVLALAAEKAVEDHWSQWRGPSGQGYCDDKTVPLNWSETENLLWKTRLPGAGNSTPIVWGDRIFLTTASEKGNERSVLCVNARDGRILWQDTPAS